MTDQTKATRRDEVLFAFYRDCASPTVDEIIRWTERYPEFAEDIRDHAGLMREWEAGTGDAVEEEISEQMLSRAHSRTLNAIYRAEMASQSSGGQQATFDQLLGAVGLTKPELSKSLDIGRDVIAALFNGWMKPPVGSRLTQALLDKLRVTAAQFDWAVNYAVDHPQVGHAKASKTPTVVQSSYAEIVRKSTMSPERILYWLEDA